MSKLIKILLWLAGLTLVLYFVVGPIMKSQTKKHSPEKTVVYEKDNLKIDVFYCSPAKKDREIFGSLVPYGEVWRTGANEASTFTTNKDLEVAGETLAAGKYTLWTIPGENDWKIIFNNKMYDWGVTITGQVASREAEYDALIVNAKASKTSAIMEDFTINFSETSPLTTVMTIAWDDVIVPVAIRKKQ
ncbi:DUF2911 domain-containing protein [Ulvibacter antarcticus]|uniref:DUF2911 family protein n=1 Tax=Ulvibacter antarcticus TaxID=442714 RepID=A0A3L9YJ23_9FLAO|nr:DUF2911 domain-containing protein [Ulvibacter antarcticus]RMA57938.1 Protein of unknown function (DUF2911) [Ulvibacter antarcticus]